MASQVKTQSRNKSSTASAQAAKVKDYVNQQLEKTRKQVKTVDFIASLLVMIVGVIGFLIVAAVVDAWIWPLSSAGRWACLIAIIVGCIAYTVSAIVPLFLRRINPDYAAKMIEDAKPNFRNSLMNYVSLRKRPEEIKPAVFDAVSRQAASDLASVPGDTNVDQSKLIRLGFILVALTVFAVGYKMLSPKDPLQTVARILAPPAKIAQPAVVIIEDVLPGDTKVFFGEQLEVTANVRGRHRAEDVRLVYSTVDGQITDQSIAMTPAGSTGQYRADLTMAGRGIQSSLRYHVEARDGVSPDYEVVVRPNPSIAIESLVLTPPFYTKIPPRTLTGTGDIEAIEGTNVLIHAVANLPIKVAYIELLNEVNNPNQLGEVHYDDRYRVIATPIKMQFEGKSAVAQITVALNSQRSKPFASHYRIRFVSTEDDRNNRPNVYPIRVIPDLEPEIKILNPLQQETEVPVNGVLPISIEARDPDFEVRAVNLSIDHAGRKLFDKRLEHTSTNENRRVNAEFQFSPAKLGLRAGDRAMFHATATDNRVSHSGNQPVPSRTSDYTVIVTGFDQQAESEKKNDPDEKAEQDPSKQEKSDSGNSEDGNDGEEKGESDQPGETGSEEGGAGSESAGSESEPGEGETGESGGAGGSGENGSQDQSARPEEGGGGGSGQPQNDSGDQPAGQKNPSDGEQQSSGSKDPGNDENSGSGKQPSEGNQSDQGDASNGDPNSGDPNQTPDGAGAGNQDASGGAEADRDSAGGSKSGGAEGRKDDSLTDGTKEKLSENASEGERMKELQEHFENKESDPGSGNQEQPPNDPPNEDSQAGDPAGGGKGDPNQPQPSQGNPQDGNPQDGTPQEGNPDAEPGQDNPNEPGAEPKPDASAGGESDNGADAAGKSNQGQQNKSNTSSADGKQTEVTGEQQDTPKTDRGETAPDSNNNDNVREESGKPGMEDATGNKSTDPGGEETNQTGNESGGTDPGKSDSPGNEKGDNPADQTDGGKPDSGEQGQSGEKSGSEQPSSEKSAGDDSGGQEPGGETGKSSEGGKPGAEQSGENGQQEGESGDQAGNKSSPSDNGAKPSDGGKPGQAGDGKAQSDPSAEGMGSGTGGSASEQLQRDQENLEHTKKATDMVLKKLSEQRYDPDPELLKKMNWTQQDMENFLNRWEEMKRAAELGSPAARKKYEKSLKSLGLRPDSKRKTAKELKESATGLSQESVINRPSPEIEPDYNSFLRDLKR